MVDEMMVEEPSSTLFLRSFLRNKLSFDENTPLFFESFFNDVVESLSADRLRATLFILSVVSFSFDVIDVIDFRGLLERLDGDSGLVMCASDLP